MLKIKNTLTKKKEIFKPIETGKVRFYQCGPTVYWNQHIGNLRAFVLADFIHKSLIYLNYEVNFVRNYTDVGHLTSDCDTGEDKMEKAVQREKINPLEIAQKYINQTEVDLKKLNILEPKFKPKATEYIQEMQVMIAMLLEKGFAYQTELAIYFDISKIKDYTKLSGQKIEDNLTGAGCGNFSDDEKKNPADFSLWFFKKGFHQNALQTWKSPWGIGFPGWHIECSAMAKALLGKTLDLKMGGVEHISIHHTNEIAQSENVNNAKYVHYWLHNEWLMYENGKMAKSEGTSILVSDLEKKGFSGLDLRYFFLQAHYRSKQNFTWKALQASAQVRKKIINKINTFPAGGKVDKILQAEFIQFLEDDFALPRALTVVFKVFKSNLSAADKKTTILDFDKVLGVFKQ